MRYKSEVCGFDSGWCHWNFSMTYSIRPHYDPGVESASNRNEHQEYFLEVKAAGAYNWQPYHLHVPIVLKSGSLNLLEHSGPVQACHGIALPLTLPLPSLKLLPKLYTNICIASKVGKSCSYKFTSVLFKSVNSWIKLRRPWVQTLCIKRWCKNKTVYYCVNFIIFPMTEMFSMFLSQM